MSPSDSQLWQPQALLFSARRFIPLRPFQSGSPKFLVELFKYALPDFTPESPTLGFQLSFQAPVLASALLSSLATFVFAFRGFRCRFACAAARTFAVPEAPTHQFPSASLGLLHV